LNSLIFLCPKRSISGFKYSKSLRRKVLQRLLLWQEFRGRKAHSPKGDCSKAKQWALGHSQASASR